MKTTFARFAGYYAVLAGLAGFLYSLAFIVLKSSLLSALFLLLGGFFATAAILAVYQHVRETEPGFALWGLLFALAGAFGSIVHAGYDLSNAIHPPPRSIRTCPVRSTRAAWQPSVWPGWVCSSFPG